MTSAFSGVAVAQGPRLLLRSLRFCSNSHASVRNCRPFAMDSSSVRVSSSNGGGGDGEVRFPLSSAASGALIIQKGDITKWSIDGSTDAIVNPANERMLGGGGADGEVSSFQLLMLFIPLDQFTMQIIIQLPLWRMRTGRNSLKVAKENSIQYIAFPAISCGVYGYPYDEAATVAISSIKEFPNDFKEVHFVLFLPEIYDTWVNKAKELLKE
ncbi:uncharacterized protein LOC107605213 isoform X2 [Arachis ipaensis]|uniref:uncharacterized protein LOC107605213 isoform X2 n=1 Tax=Arachis ipaensis TaxID=130454 RepID=UPI000A2B3844|nr:uncharacterized protein LOC107605213 isoform X2 [Arachis ipaensis]